MQEMLVQSLGLEDSLEKEMTTHSSILTWKSHGKRSQAGYSPRGHKESDTTEQEHGQEYIYIYKKMFYVCISMCVCMLPAMYCVKLQL